MEPSSDPLVNVIHRVCVDGLLVMKKPIEEDRFRLGTVSKGTLGYVEAIENGWIRWRALYYTQSLKPMRGWSPLISSDPADAPSALTTKTTIPLLLRPWKGSYLRVVWPSGLNRRVLPSTKAPTLYPPLEKDFLGLPQTTFQDKEGNIWVGWKSGGWSGMQFQNKEFLQPIAFEKKVHTFQNIHDQLYVKIRSAPSMIHSKVIQYIKPGASIESQCVLGNWVRWKQEGWTFFPDTREILKIVSEASQDSRDRREGIFSKDRERTSSSSPEFSYVLAANGYVYKKEDILAQLKKNKEEVEEPRTHPPSCLEGSSIRPPLIHTSLFPLTSESVVFQD